MKIKCPDCGTSYDIKAEALGSEGRSVKCARCSNRWHVSPPKAPEPDASDIDEEEWARDQEAEARAEDVPPAAANPDIKSAAAPAPAAKAATATASPPDPDEDLDENGETSSNKSTDIESQATRTKIKVNPYKHRKDTIGAIINWLLRRNFRRISGVALFGASVVICLFFLLIRDELVKKSPDLASLFETIGLEINLRGLEFRDLRTFKDIADGRPALVIEGTIHNIKAETITVPAVRLSLRDAELQEIYAWTIEPHAKRLNALDEARFRTILTEVPSGVADIQVRFVDRSLAKTSQ
ncbi:MJ0042-type zinc finger domain-containing protein [Roseibium limicola]|uniref:Zinc-ribbon domain-containing protein n=1 Tax=Roseibium limicola TaxID=2816037 RepID=A0A939EQI9_9HYPH|nr:MJ0042-type zinc finger domain-containing protein [Roseibium limicola]MBO0347095.1 zinc-ribbon domain-containing protein [Roseibium limicola]